MDIPKVSKQLKRDEGKSERRTLFQPMAKKITLI